MPRRPRRCRLAATYPQSGWPPPARVGGVGRRGRRATWRSCAPAARWKEREQRAWRALQGVVRERCCGWQLQAGPRPSRLVARLQPREIDLYGASTSVGHGWENPAREARGRRPAQPQRRVIGQNGLTQGTPAPQAREARGDGAGVRILWKWPSWRGRQPRNWRANSARHRGAAASTSRSRYSQRTNLYPLLQSVRPRMCSHPADLSPCTIT